MSPKSVKVDAAKAMPQLKISRIRKKYGWHKRWKVSLAELPFAAILVPGASRNWLIVHSATIKLRSACPASNVSVPWPSGLTIKPATAEPKPWPKIGAKAPAANTPSRSRFPNHASAKTAGVFMIKGEATAAMPWPQKSPKNPKVGTKGRRTKSENHRKKLPKSWSQHAMVTTFARPWLRNSQVHNQLPGT